MGLPLSARTKGRFGKRLLLLIVSLVLSLVGAEFLFRWLRSAPYSAPTLRTGDGKDKALSEIIRATRNLSKGVELPHPRGTLGVPSTYRIGYDRPTWDYFDADGCVDVQINSLGFHDLEFQVAKPPDELRIIAVGDSFTFGIGVLLKDCWVQVLEQQLRTSQGRPVEVINAGFAAGSHWPPGYVDWLNSDGVAFDPDIVIIGICLNDLCWNVPMLGYPIVVPEPWLGGVSELLYFAQQKLAQRTAMAKPYDARVIVDTDPRHQWEQCQVSLREIKANLSKHGIRLVVAIQPMVSRLGDDYPFLGLHTYVVDFCKEAGIECVDLLPKFRGRDDQTLQVHPVDQHPNHHGHRLIAEGIFEYLAPSLK